MYDAMSSVITCELSLLILVTLSYMKEGLDER